MKKEAISKKGKLRKIDKRYNIRFSYAGYFQYADFYEADGKLVNPSFSASYSKVGESPDVSKMETIEEVLKAIKGFANYAELNLINGAPVNYYNNEEAKEYISKFDEKYDKFIQEEALAYFKEVLEPIMVANNWFVASSHIGAPVLIEKNEDGEWDNIKHDSREFDFDYLCYKFARNFRDIKANFKSEHNKNSVHGASMAMFALVPGDYINEKGYYLNLEKE